MLVRIAGIYKNWAGFPPNLHGSSLENFRLALVPLFSFILGRGRGGPRVDRQGNPVWKPLVFILGGFPFEFRSRQV